MTTQPRVWGGVRHGHRSVHVAGGPEGDLPGLDIRGLLIGSEGTLAVVTAVWVRIMRSPEAVETLLAIYDDPEQAGQSV
ncbi:MAG: hypothetical protein U5J83_19340 [Bryobacterales bacterium]|nr:hypothetical protein [Bryobacterales bacterium]